jgi:hypothetical protein
MIRQSDAVAVKNVCFVGEVWNACGSGYRGGSPNGAAVSSTSHGFTGVSRWHALSQNCAGPFLSGLNAEEKTIADDIRQGRIPNIARSGAIAAAVTLVVVRKNKKRKMI